jgi:gamma-glutamyl-gamma-aminobutyrate hydrolase PuuD
VKMTTHDVRIDAGSKLAGVLGESALAPAMHHQGINRLGTGLTAVAWTKDQVIEAVEVTGHRFGVGVQWHPEEGDDARIFDALVNAAKAAPVSQPVPVGQAVGQAAADMSSRSKRPAKRQAARR